MKPGIGLKNSSSIFDFDALLNDQFSVQEFDSKFEQKTSIRGKKRERKKLVECELGRDIIYLDDAQCRDNR